MKFKDFINESFDKPARIIWRKTNVESDRPMEGLFSVGRLNYKVVLIHRGLSVGKTTCDSMEVHFSVYVNGNWENNIQDSDNAQQVFATVVAGAQHGVELCTPDIIETWAYPDQDEQVRAKRVRVYKALFSRFGKQAGYDFSMQVGKKTYFKLTKKKIRG